jgi:hypothetical protein
MKDGATTAKAFKQKFIQEFGSLNCAELMKGFAVKEEPLGCAKLTATATVFLAELLEGIGKKDEADMNVFSYQPHQKIDPGTCPFTGCTCK